MKAKMTMHHRFASHWGSTAVVVALLAGMLAWPGTGHAQTASGQAAAVRATVLGLFGGGTTTTLADTGTLGSSTDAREASQRAGDVPSLLSGEVLHATTIGWPDQVASEASLADLALSLAGNTVSIGSDFVMAQAVAVLGAAGAGTSNLVNLSINGAPISVSGEPNQIFYVPGGRVVINEQIASAGGIVVNALHVIVDGVADVVIGSARAQIQ